MTNLRKAILATLAAITLVGTMQPSYAGNGWNGPNKFKAPIQVGPTQHPKHHHKHNYEGAALGLLGGIIIGSAIANAQQQPVYVGNGNAHVAWCLDRYMSYDIPSDTYMSNSGYRKYCNSPYR